MRVLLILLALLLQDPPTKSVGKSSAAPYRSALETYREAERALSGRDHATALDKANSILENKTLDADKRECFLKIQNDDSTWASPQPFYPSRVRGQALLAKAKKQLADGNREGALVSLKDALKSLDESRNRNVPGAAQNHKDVSELIAANEGGSTDPAVLRKRTYDDKISDARKAENEKRYPDAKRLYEEALQINKDGEEAVRGVEKMALRIREVEAYQALLAVGEKEAQLAACDEFLKNFPEGELRDKVTSKRDEINRKLAAGLEASERKFDTKWEDLVNGKKFKSALDHLRTEGAFLPADKAKRYEERTKTAGDEHIADKVSGFRVGIRAISSPADVAAQAPDWMERELALPEEKELISTTPELKWCRRLYGALAKLRELGADPAPVPVLDMVEGLWKEAPALVERGENPYFRVLVALARGPVRDRQEAINKEAGAAEAGALVKLEEEARGLMGRIDTLDARLVEALAGQGDQGKAWRERHRFWETARADFERVFEEFPRDDPAIDALGRRLTDAESADGVCGTRPRQALEAIEKELYQLHTKKQVLLTRDCRRRLLCYLIVASSQRRLLEGAAVADVAKQLGGYASDLKGAGGAVPDLVKPFGPKIQRVFRELPQ